MDRKELNRYGKSTGGKGNSMRTSVKKGMHWAQWGTARLQWKVLTAVWRKVSLRFDHV